MKYHQSDKKEKGHRVTVLDKIKDKYNYGDIQFPADYESIKHFEDLNQVCIYVYIYDEESDQILLDKPGKADYIVNDCIYLLRIEKDNQSHYIYIKKIEHLLNLHTHSVDKDTRYCPICQKNIKLDDYRSHLSACYKFSKDSTLLKLPEPGSTMKFKNFKIN